MHFIPPNRFTIENHYLLLCLVCARKWKAISGPQMEIPSIITYFLIFTSAVLKCVHIRESPLELYCLKKKGTYFLKKKKLICVYKLKGRKKLVSYKSLSINCTAGNGAKQFT